MPYYGEIRMFAGNFAPTGWAFCDGSSLAISDYETLFQLIGTTYGGDGEATFNLPDLRGRVPVHYPGGTGLTNYALGETAGVETVTLTTEQVPAHTHPLNASTAPGNSAGPQGRVLGSAPATSLYRRENPTLPLAPSMVQPTGGSEAHENRVPFLAINFIISLIGEYPPPA